jgi:FixJ family two-component response regulator
MPAGCVVLDLLMPGMGGLEVQRQLLAGGRRWPVIVLTGHPDRRSMMQAMQAGSVFFLEKPVREAELFAAVLTAEAVLRGEARERQDPLLAHAVALFTMRERQVLEALMISERVKQTAARLGISESRVKSCRRQVMRKLGAKSTSQLIQQAVLAGVRVSSRS